MAKFAEIIASLNETTIKIGIFHNLKFTLGPEFTVMMAYFVTSRLLCTFLSFRNYKITYPILVDPKIFLPGELCFS